MSKKIITFTLTILLLLEINSLANNNSTYDLLFEYRNDEIDYDSIDKNFFRGKIKLNTSKKSFFNFSYIHIQKNAEERITWNLAMKDISKNFSFIIGNFHANFGSGLIIGKKQPFSRDDFATGLILSFNKRFKPSSSGNPLYSFNGIAATYQYQFTDILLSINSFFSIRNRYINIDDYMIKKIKSSLSSINNYQFYNYNHSEPILVMDKGLMVELVIFNRVLFQSYFIHADMKNTDGKKISWAHDPGEIGQSIKSYYAWGFFINYFDDYLDIFIEFGLPFKKTKNGQSQDIISEQYGAVYSFSYNNNFFSISIIGKNCGKNFSSPYSSGETYALDQWIIKSLITPIKPVIISAIFSIAKKLLPTTYEQALPATKKEEISIKYSHKIFGGFKISCSLVQKEMANGDEEKLRIKSNIFFNISHFARLFLKGTFQKKQNNYSGCLNPGINLFYKKYFKLRCHYTRFFITGDNPIYSTSGSFYNAISTGFISQKSSNLIAIGLSGNYKFFTIILEYNNRFLINKIINQEFEVMLKSFF